MFSLDCCKQSSLVPASFVPLSYFVFASPWKSALDNSKIPSYSMTLTVSSLCVVVHCPLRAVVAGVTFLFFEAGGKLDPAILSSELTTVKGSTSLVEAAAVVDPTAVVDCGLSLLRALVTIPAVL